uniref:Ubiquitin conjugating enzyme E2 T n=1 Tax=Homo sapiens TaxID=9606 RepID=A0A2R8Y812_HUMAN
MQRASRLKRELHMLATEPPPGITCWQDKDQMDDLRARRNIRWSQHTL